MPIINKNYEVALIKRPCCVRELLRREGVGRCLRTMIVLRYVDSGEAALFDHRCSAAAGEQISSGPNY